MNRGVALFFTLGNKSFGRDKARRFSPSPRSTVIIRIIMRGAASARLCVTRIRSEPVPTRSLRRLFCPILLYLYFPVRGQRATRKGKGRRSCPPPRAASSSFAKRATYTQQWLAYTRVGGRKSLQQIQLSFHCQLLPTVTTNKDV